MAKTVLNQEFKEKLKKAESFREADALLDSSWCKTDSDKLFFLKQLFGDEKSALGRSRSGKIYDEYKSYVLDIIKKGA